MSQDGAKNGSAKHTFFLVVLIVAVALFVAGYVVKGKKGENTIITNGDRAPEFRLPALNGQYVNLSDLRGKVVMVHFWATWCPPCVEEIPTLAQLYQNFRGKDFVMLAISVDEGGAQAVTSFLERNKLSIPVLLDPDQTTAHHYGTYKFPETYIIDRTGVVRYKVIGSRDWRDPSATQIINNIMGSGS